MLESSISMPDSCRSQVSQCMTPAGVKYVSMYDSCRTPAGVKYVYALLVQESSMSVCMTPAGGKYLNL